VPGPTARDHTLVDVGAVHGDHAKRSAVPVGAFALHFDRLSKHQTCTCVLGFGSETLVFLRCVDAIESHFDLFRPTQHRYGVTVNDADEFPVVVLPCDLLSCSVLFLMPIHG
jgi:hypothetical protein